MARVIRANPHKDKKVIVKVTTGQPTWIRTAGLTGTAARWPCPVQQRRALRVYDGLSGRMAPAVLLKDWSGRGVCSYARRAVGGQPGA